MMDLLHRKIIQKNRTSLIDNITNPLDVVELLYVKNLFTESMKQDVEAEKTQNAQVRKILDIVPRRGPNAFSIFYECLLESSNTFAADLLRPELSQAHPQGGVRGYAIPQQEVELPQDWPNKTAMEEEIFVRPCNVRSEVITNNWLNPNVYSMKRKCRGRCLILSNQTFVGPLKKDKDGIERCILPPRHGNVKDVTDLTKLFTQLQFDVRCKEQLTAQAMHRELSAESSHPDHNSAECFVCIICSHGTQQGIYGIDGNTISLDEVTTYFDGAKCPPLRLKPKLFFIQACRGETVDAPGHIAEETNAGQDLSNLLKVKLRITDEKDCQKDTTDAAPVLTPHTGPTKADMLVACATHAGFVSLRNTRYGSWFIQAVIYVFQRYACKEDIVSLLTLVNNLVARGRSQLEGQGDRDVMQASQYTSSLVKKFFFFPGVGTDSGS